MTTTGIVLIEEHAQRVKPPRMLAVPFFFGNALGEDDNPEYQHKVLQATFDLLDRDQGPVLEQLPDDQNSAGFDKPSQLFKWIFLVALLGIFENHCRQNGLLILDF